MLLSIRIRRISSFDCEKNRKEIDGLQGKLQGVEKHLADIQAYAVRYLKSLLKTYGPHHSRRTEITTFDTIELKELTARELDIHYDKEKGYLGYGIKEGRVLLRCSSYDKIVLVWEDGRYKVVQPPETLFVDTGLIYCAKMDRNLGMTMVYAENGITYVKRFRFGGAILNKEYQCAGKGSNILFLADDEPEEIYVKYKPAKGQRIHQQLFRIGDLPVIGVKAWGSIMAPKEIQNISKRKPRWWKDDEPSPPGIL